MPSSNHLQNIVVVGGTGNIGLEILTRLLSAPTSPTITLLTRTPPSSSLTNAHPSLRIAVGPYDSPDTLIDAFSGQDAVVFALHFSAMATQSHMIKFAVEAGVTWILPTEYAGDGLNFAMVSATPLFRPKLEARQLISTLACEQKVQGRRDDEVVKWIGVATNPWVEPSLARGLFGINLPERKAKLYQDGEKFNVTTLSQAGRGVAALLSLPIKPEGGDEKKCLQAYANTFAYLSSASVTQSEIFASVLLATHTAEADWTIDRTATISAWERGLQEKFAEGDMMAGAGLTFVNYMGVGRGGDYEDKAARDREVLGLAEEGVDEVVAKGVRMAERVGKAFR